MGDLFCRKIRENMKLRPLIHFTPEYGWMNDPNGPIYYNDQYHLFYQYNPNGLTWDSMHWGHAISKDLMHWEHLPIALFPDEMGDIFSGSCIYDINNVSGLRRENIPPLLAFYTSHNVKTKREEQCVAISYDGISFDKYANNPIIIGFDNTPCRDPHVSYDKKNNNYRMCLTREDEVIFYSSDNLLDWELTGNFRIPEYALKGMIECPNLFEVKVEGEDEYKTVLMVSMDISESEYEKLPSGCPPHKRLVQYFVGDYDGRKFNVDRDICKTLLIDMGEDFYAGTVFSNTDDVILIAWLGNSTKGMEIPTETEGFRGVMSYPRRLSLVKNNESYCLKQSFYPTPINYKDSLYYTDQGREELIDGCVQEVIKDEGINVYTSYNMPN